MQENNSTDSNNSKKKISWTELMEKANNVHHTAAPNRRNQKLARVARELTDAQKALLAQGRGTRDNQITAFIEEVSTDIRYIPENSAWLYWNGYVWEWDVKGYAAELVKDYGRQLKLSIIPSDTDEMKKAMNDAHAYFTSAKGISETLKIASTDPMMVASIEEFDADIYALNTPAGVVDLYTGNITEPKPESLVKRSTTITPDANCITPLYDRLLAEAFAGEPELSEYFEQMMGVSLVMSQDTQNFMYMFGAAGSGKGTLMNLALDILGKGEGGYAVYVDSSMFIQSGATAHPTELMQFLGARVAISSEVTQGQKMDTGKLKKLTGGDAITGRFMGKDFVTFDPTHTLWIMANDRLQVPHDDKGVWRRLRVIDFKHSKKDGEVIIGLQSRIFDQEAPGVLARWIEKAGKYLNEGFETPDVVMQAIESYVAEQDTVAEWLDVYADTTASDDGKESFCIVAAARDSYLDWCRKERKTPLTPKKFGDALEAKGFTRDKKYVNVDSQTRKQVRVHTGLRLV